MGRPKKLIGDKLEAARKMVEANIPRSTICRELNVSYVQLSREFGNLWKQKRGSVGTASEA